MDTIGEKLKNARIENGLTIGDLQRITKIQRRYLEALEDNDFDAIPSDYYLRTFIKQYAEVVGLNPRPLLRRVEGNSGIHEQASPSIPVQGSRRVKHSNAASKRNLFKTYIPVVTLVIVVIAIISTIGYAVWKDSKSGPLVPKPEKTTLVDKSVSSSNDNSTNDSSNSSKQKADEEKKKQEEAEKERKKKEAEKKPEFKIKTDTENAITYDISNVKKPNVTLTGVNAAAWFGIQETGTTNIFYQNTAQPGEPIKVDIPEGINSVDIIVGASNYLTISVDGQELKFNETHPVTGKKIITLNFSGGSQPENSDTAVETENNEQYYEE
ncbi:helix-turn-helix domain-containing protein [Vagococcus vulneris]|uniref:DUF4115 domain-containing protein n=1 Tax=Vagococcus vulneris TaxID=1977869 RepID=A0A429ZV33_9ENTE|nr:helix-turn-helix domain-containing protein [Vagococcus vulneris]RST97606.1 hypothetical protein CBF37_09545 [Vagococcus vulneris]